MEQVQLLRRHKLYKQIHMFWTVQPSVELATGQHLEFNSGRNSYSCSNCSTSWFFMLNFLVICVHPHFWRCKTKVGPLKIGKFVCWGGGVAKGVGWGSEAPSKTLPRFFNQQKKLKFKNLNTDNQEEPSNSYSYVFDWLDSVNKKCWSEVSLSDCEHCSMSLFKEYTLIKLRDT